MNVAALGNMVPQLHFHHVVRYQNDVALLETCMGYTSRAIYK